MEVQLSWSPCRSTRLRLRLEFFAGKAKQALSGGVKTNVMKTLTLLCAAAFLAAPLKDSAQDNSAQDTPSERPSPLRLDRPDGLTPEEAKRFTEAREKAKNDPAVRSLEEARKALDQQIQTAMRTAILAVDPQLAPTLDKVKQSVDRAKGMRERFQSLPPEKKVALKSAHESAKKDPGVISAKQKFDAASTPEEKITAGREMRQAMRAAVLEQNPDLAPLLDQLGRDGRGPRNGAGQTSGPATGEGGKTE